MKKIAGEIVMKWRKELENKALDRRYYDLGLS